MKRTLTAFLLAIGLLAGAATVPMVAATPALANCNGSNNC